MRPFRLVCGLVGALLCLSSVGCGEADSSVEPEERRIYQEVYQETFDQPAGNIRMPPPDPFFVDYDPAVLERLRVDTTGAARWIDSTLQALSLEEKIAQLFIVELPKPSGLRALFSDEARQLTERGVGGFLVPRTLDPQEVYERVRRLQESARVPLFFAADYERGAGRFSNAFTELPSNMALGATRDTSLAAAAARLTAIESRAAGVNLLFAPVVDVNNNPDNPIINIRSYGEDPQLVGRMAEAFVRSSETRGLLSTLKHFPGHGNTSTDTHAAMGAVTGARAALESIELAPYRMVLGGEGPKPTGVMTAHLWVEALDAEPLPATLSRNVLGGLLREELGFEGLVVTDDVKMGGLQNDYDLTERTVRPLEAGADVILTPDELSASIDALKGALERGRLSEEILDRSVRRILRAKATAGLHQWRLPPEDVINYLLEEARGEALAQAIADHSVTLLTAESTLPLRTDARTLLLQLSNYEGAESIDAAMDDFAELLGEEGRPLEALRYDREPDEADREAVLEAIQEADVVVLALYLRLQSGRGEAGLHPRQRQLVERLLEEDVPVVLVAFGNPYAVSVFPETQGHLVAYDQTLASVYATARILQGQQPPRGQLPITVEPYAYGSGLQALPSDTLQGQERTSTAFDETRGAAGQQ